MSEERTYEVLDEVRHNLEEIDQRYKELMRAKILVNFLVYIGLIVVLFGFGRILWFVWGLE